VRSEKGSFSQEYVVYRKKKRRDQSGKYPEDAEGD